MQTSGINFGLYDHEEFKICMYMVTKPIKKMKKIVILSLIFMFWLTNSTMGQALTNFTKKNLSYYYYPGVEIKLNYEIIREDEGHTVFLNVVSLEGIDLRNNYTLSYDVRDSYQAKEIIYSDTIPYQDILFRDNSSFIFRTRLPSTTNNNLMMVHLTNHHTTKVLTFDIPIKNEFIFPRADIYIKKDGFPLFTNYFNVEDSVVFSSNSQIDGKVFAYYYNTDFKAADPPMANQTQRATEQMNIDTVIIFSLNEKIKFDRHGLYFVQLDTTTTEGLGILAQDVFFPRLAQINDVTGPLIYITTRAERERLMSGNDRKKEMDRFWLTLAKSPDNAKNLIKAYYQRVREANYYFSAYKEGWKTDMGMIYILYGPPDEVYRDEEKEEWKYDKIEDIPSLTFSFMKVKNIFTDKHFVLVRSKDYERQWYRIVDMWRKGRFSNVQVN